MKFLQNRLGIDFTYYNNTSKDLIIPVKVPVTSGYDQIYLNSGSIRNKGVEISLSRNTSSDKKFFLMHVLISLPTRIQYCQFILTSPRLPLPVSLAT